MKPSICPWIASRAVEIVTLAECAWREQALFQNESSAESKMWEEALGVHIQV